MNVQDIVNQTASANAPSTADRVGSNELGKNEFLKLMLAQLGNQDPTKPQDSQAFVAQLAQFSSVEQLTSANQRLDDILLAQAANTQTAATALVGKDASFRTDKLTLVQGEPVSSGVSLAAEATDVRVTVMQDGKPMRTINLGAQGAGHVSFTWDGLRDDGGTALPGNYDLQVSAKNQAGEAVEVETHARGLVRGVSFKDGTPQLLIGDQKISMSQVVDINQRSNP